MKKIKPKDVAYELRELSKNNSLSPEIINIISHGYERICELERERDEARRMACGHGETIGGAMIEADLLGWDCFKENPDA